MLGNDFEVMNGGFGMRIELIYATKTGHSRKIALGVAKELGITAQDIKDNPKLENVDMLFIVGGIYGGKSMPELITYVKSLSKDSVKRAALLTSSAGLKTPQTEVRQILSENGVTVVEDEFKCKGKFIFVSRKHPNEEDINNAVVFAKRMIAEGAL